MLCMVTMSNGWVGFGLGWDGWVGLVGWDSDLQGLMVIRQFGEDWSKTLPLRIFFLQNFLVVVITLCLNKLHHLL